MNRQKVDRIWFVCTHFHQSRLIKDLRVNRIWLWESDGKSPGKFSGYELTEKYTGAQSPRNPPRRTPGVTTPESRGTASRAIGCGQGGTPGSRALAIVEPEPNLAGWCGRRPQVRAWGKGYPKIGDFRCFIKFRQYFPAVEKLVENRGFLPKFGNFRFPTGNPPNGARHRTFSTIALNPLRPKG
jgi:hypothetical protein